MEQGVDSPDYGGRSSFDLFPGGGSLWLGRGPWLFGMVFFLSRPSGDVY